MMECMTGTASEKGNTMEEIIDKGEKKTESGEKFLKGHPGFGLSLRPPQPSLFLSGMTLSSVRPFTGGEQDKRS